MGEDIENNEEGGGKEEHQEHDDNQENKELFEEGEEREENKPDTKFRIPKIIKNEDEE